MGGYFIVNGLEKVIRMLIMPRRNYVSHFAIVNISIFRSSNSMVPFDLKSWYTKQLKLHRLIVTLPVFNGKSVYQKKDPQVSQLLPILSTSSFNELLPLDDKFYEVFSETKTGKDQQYVAIMFNKIRSTDKSTLLKLCHSADYYLL